MNLWNTNGLAAVAAGLGAGIREFASHSAGAASRANAISKQAQTDQGNFNQASANNANSIAADRIAEQYAYNSAQAASANAFSEHMWERAAEFNAAEAQKNRDFQERMRNTAYQAAVKDMEAAGLNPILAATNGISTGTAGGSAASIGTVSGQMASGGVLQGVSASEGMYTGQMEYMGGMLGLLSAALGGLATALKVSSQMPAGEQFMSSLLEFLHDDNSKYSRIGEQAARNVESYFDQEIQTGGRGERWYKKYNNRQ